MRNRVASRGNRGLIALKAALVSLWVVTVGGSMFVLVTASSGSPYCGFKTASSMEIMSPWNWGDSSPNGTVLANGTVSFSASAYSCVAPFSFDWVFGDGQTYHVGGVLGPNATASIAHVYAGPGSYPGQQTISDSAGHSEIIYFCISAQNWPALTGSAGSYPRTC